MKGLYNIETISIPFNKELKSSL